MGSKFVDRLALGPILLDGGVGTLLETLGGPVGTSLEMLNLDDPARVQTAHKRFIEAGAQIVTTNSFMASAIALRPYGAADRVRDVNRRAARLARDTRDLMGVDVLISGSVGPLGEYMEGTRLGRLTAKKARAAFEEQISALVEGGVDLIALETFFDLNEALLALETARAVSDLPVVAMLAFDDDARTALGHGAADAVLALRDAGATVVGANCGTGPRGAINAIREMAGSAPGFPLAAMPNAGLPMRSHNRLHFPTGTEYAAAFAEEALSLGARLVGGCCGMGPEHIAAMAAVLAADGTKTNSAARAAVSGPTSMVYRPVATAEVAPAATSLPEGTPSLLASMIQNQEFIISIEMHPPRTHLIGSFIETAREFKAAGVEMVNLLDSPMARVRMDPLMACELVRREVGLETIAHLTPRDRTLLGLQTELIGAHAQGVRNILCVSGDPHPGGVTLGTVNVYDVDSIGMIRLLAGYNRGVDVKGNDMGQPTQFLIGAALNPNAPDLDLEADRFHQKIQEGAHYVMVQPVWDLEALDRLIDRLGRPKVPIIVGICPIHSYQHALLLHNEIPGIRLTEEVLERMRKAEANAEQEGIAIARELLAAAREVCQGAYIMPSYGRHWMALKVIEE
ncbi:MAG TPA: bifunctional homocysteine S-methyltransferase/methylenetetrahydrofolate reductase [Chloroflexota bacterium]